jgi:hypothetical protein
MCHATNWVSTLWLLIACSSSSCGINCSHSFCKQVSSFSMSLNGTNRWHPSIFNKTHHTPCSLLPENQSRLSFDYYPKFWLFTSQFIQKFTSIENSKLLKYFRNFQCHGEIIRTFLFVSLDTFLRYIVVLAVDTDGYFLSSKYHGWFFSILRDPCFYVSLICCDCHTLSPWQLAHLSRGVWWPELVLAATESVSLHINNSAAALCITGFLSQSLLLNHLLLLCWSRHRTHTKE